MKFTWHILTVAAALFFTACSQKEETTTGGVVQETTPPTESSLFLSDSTSVSSTGSQTQSSGAVGGVPSVSAPAGALNPAHGEPGHRCDIAVGAPLSSPAGTGMTPNPQTTLPVQQVPATQSVTINPQQAANTESSAPNPAHGEPGHRCDIAVGAPLNSPAGTGMTPGTQTTLPVQQVPAQAPAIQTEPAATPE